LNPNGYVNTSFGTGGYVALFNPFIYAGSMLLQPDGAIVTTGASGGAGCYSMPFEWVSSSGYNQTYISANFMAAEPVAATSQQFWGSIFPDSAGGVGIVGLSRSCDGTTSGAVATSQIQEFNPDGTPLSSFGTDGTVNISTPDPNDFNFSAAVLPNRHLVVESFQGNTSPIVNLRDFQENGQVVANFGHAGLIQLDVPSLKMTATGAETEPSAVAALARGDFGLLVPVQNGLTLEEIVG
jgi:hypothetical protein